MDKRLLAKVSIRPAPKELVELAKETHSHKCFVLAEIITLKDKKILLMHLYPQKALAKGDTQAELRVFLTKDDYITQVLNCKGTKWRTGSMGCFFNYYDYVKQYICADEQSGKAICQYVGCEAGDEFEKINIVQRRIIRARLEQRHKKLTDKIDAKMALVPELPKDFEKWIEEIALFENRYIYYVYQKGRKEMDGYCTHCKNSVLVCHPLNNTRGICPDCGSPITFKASRKSVVHDREQASILQKTPIGFVIRYFKISKDYRNDFRKPKLYFWEFARSLYEGRTGDDYYYGNFRQSGIMRWCNDQDPHYYDFGAVYDKTIDEALEGTAWQYSAMLQLAVSSPGCRFKTFNFLRAYLRWPFIEYLIKLRLYNLAKDVIEQRSISNVPDYGGKSLEQILGVPKEFVPILQEIDANVESLRILQVAIEQKIKITADQLRYIQENLGCNTSLIRVAQYSSVEKILNYLKKVFTESRKTKIQDIASDWLDYVENCQKLKYDRYNEFVLFPRDLHKAHNEAYKEVERKQTRKYDKEFSSFYEEVTKNYEWSSGNFLFLVPKEPVDITLEGHALHHCVGTYVEKVAKRTCIIVFIRKKDQPEKPYYTLELKNDKLSQCRGKHNDGMTPEVKRAVDKYLNEIHKRKEKSGLKVRAS